ncbi:cellulose biosynthesis protein BcsS [uncultured Bradyrhizobium sp.]|uniref:cellulose biosynthesis protein BcsS n=1 Tax=uncultured Bradyrhizobium sp. TaxID=199684 RepID=UPI0035CB1E8A
MPQADGLSGGTKAERVLLYAGFDIWRYGRTGYGGFYWAPDGLNNDGFITRLFVSRGVERHDAGAARSSTDIVRVSPLAGWRFKQGTLELKVFAGPELENRTATPDVAAAKLRGTYFGARAAAELWWEPMPEMMLTSAFSASTNAASHSARAAAGRRVLDRFWAGPEISVSRDEFSAQYRMGAHLTGFTLDALEWSVAAGYVTDSYHRNGIYGRIGVLTRQ